MKRPIVKRRIKAISLALMLKGLQENAYTARELAEMCGLHICTVREYVLTMHREGVIHIAQWEPDSMGRYQTAAYVMGPGKDAKKPPRMTSAERCGNWRTREAQRHLLHAMAAPINGAAT